MDFPLLRRQFLALFRLSLRRFIFSRYFWGTITLAMIPVILALFIVGIWFLNSATMGHVPGSSTVRRLLENLYQGAYIHMAVIFTAAGFGSSVMREEIDEQTLHYFFLQPISRYLLVPAKTAAFLVVVSVIYGVSLFVTKFMLHSFLGIEELTGYFFTFDHVWRFAVECLVIVLSLMIYTALFTAISTIFRNIVYAIFIYGWELSTNYLPETLKNFSLAFHLKALLPHATIERPNVIGIMAEKPGGLQIFLVLFLVFLCCSAFAAFMSSRRQCLYGSGA